MNTLTESQLRDAFVNASKGEAKRAMIPDLDQVDFSRLDYFGWQDAKKPRHHYVALELDGEVAVLLLRGPDDSGEEAAIDAPSLLRLSTKADLDPAGRVGWHGERLHLSAVTGAGVDLLLEHLRAWAISATRSEVPALVTQRRHVAALTEALGLLDEADAEPDPVLRAESLRLAARSLDALVGTIGVEQLLDSIFGRFCIGK